MCVLFNIFIYFGWVCLVGLETLINYLVQALTTVSKSHFGTNEVVLVLDNIIYLILVYLQLGLVVIKWNIITIKKALKIEQVFDHIVLS